MLHRIRRDGPPTLLMHGPHDEMAPISAVRQLANRLQQTGAPVTAVYTDHMFDLAGTMWSPAARVTFHTLERFLAVIAHTANPGPPRPDDTATPATTRRLSPATQTSERNEHEEAVPRRMPPWHTPPSGLGGEVQFALHSDRPSRNGVITIWPQFNCTSPRTPNPHKSHALVAQ